MLVSTSSNSRKPIKVQKDRRELSPEIVQANLVAYNAIQPKLNIDKEELKQTGPSPKIKSIIRKPKHFILNDNTESLKSLQVQLLSSLSRFKSSKMQESAGKRIKGLQVCQKQNLQTKKNNSSKDILKCQKLVSEKKYLTIPMPFSKLREIVNGKNSKKSKINRDSDRKQKRDLLAINIKKTHSKSSKVYRKKEDQMLSPKENRTRGNLVSNSPVLQSNLKANRQDSFPIIPGNKDMVPNRKQDRLGIVLLPQPKKQEKILEKTIKYEKIKSGEGKRPKTQNKDKKQIISLFSNQAEHKEKDQVRTVATGRLKLNPSKKSSNTGDATVIHTVDSYAKSALCIREQQQTSPIKPNIVLEQEEKLCKREENLVYKIQQPIGISESKSYSDESITSSSTSSIELTENFEDSSSDYSSQSAGNLSYNSHRPKSIKPPYSDSSSDQLLKSISSSSTENIELSEELILYDNVSLKSSEKPKSVSGERNKKKQQIRQKERFIGVEPPKIYNKAFGSLEDFLVFFQNRGPEIAGFADKYMQIEASKDFAKLNTEIMPVVIDSIIKEAAKKARKDREKDLKNLFEKTFTSYEQFYGDILKAYTMDGFLYQNLNKYLRDEDWSQLDCLLPYVFCLCKAFLSSELASVCNNHQKGTVDNLTLFRGAQLDEAALSFYNAKGVQNFSWNAMTSTSTNREIAELFMCDSDSKKKVPVMFIIEVPLTSDEPGKQHLLDIRSFSAFPAEEEVVLAPGSIFEIIDFQRRHIGAEIRLRLVTNASKLAHQGQIMHGAMQSEVSTGRVSKLVGLEGKELIESIRHLRGNGLIEELEFILCRYDTDTLLVNILLETLPTLPRLTKVVLISIDSDDINIILKAINNLSIRSLDISLTSLEGRGYVNPLAYNSKCASSLETLRLDFRPEILINNKSLRSICDGLIKWLSSLKTLTINFPHNSNIGREGLNIICSKGLRYLTSLSNLHITFDSCDKITDNALDRLCLQGLKYLTSLTTLHLTFELLEISNKGMSSLSSEGLKYLTSLTTLHLNFDSCDKLTDKGVVSLASQGLKCLSSLTSLHLSFRECEKITDEGVNSLSCQGLRYLPSLTILHMSFHECNKITDRGVKSLSSEGLRYLTSLITLHLSFDNLKKITDAGMNSFCSEGLRYLTSLTTLNLSFEGCDGITDFGANDLCSRGLSYLISLGTLHLNFAQCFGMTDEGRENLKTKTQHLKDSLYINKATKEDRERELRKFSLKRKLENQYSSEAGNEFPRLAVESNSMIAIDSAKKIKDFYNQVIESIRAGCLTSLHVVFNLPTQEDLDEESNHLLAQGVEYLTSLDALHLNFLKFSRIDNRINTLCSQGLRYLKSLTTLHLSFYECNEITDEGMESLCSQGLRYLPSLISLHLSFHECNKITDIAMSSLSSEGLRYLTSLTTLHFDFHRCKHITDSGLNSLCSQGLRCLPSLTTLKINIDCCKQLTDKGIDVLCSQGLKYLTSLTALHLSFRGCLGITDKGVESLCSQGLRYLTSLTSLYLTFYQCENLTDKGMDSLCSQGLGYLTSLTALHLDFVECEHISDKGIKSLGSQGLKNLVSLTTLHLKFDACELITDKGVKSLCSQGLRYLTLLTTLYFRFISSSDISDKSIHSLCSYGLRYLPSLTTLHLNFLNCEEITDAGVNILCSQGLRYLTSLNTLQISFNDCFNISKAGFWNLKIFLKYFGYEFDALS